MEIQQPTSIKETFQNMIPKSMAVIRGRVISASPLKIQALNDEKLIIRENIMCLPKHLTNYTTKCDIMLDDGEIDSETQSGGMHRHSKSSSGIHDEYSESDGSQFQEETDNNSELDGEHTHNQTTFNVYSATIKVYNALKENEAVYILSFNEGKKYYILDREA
ncbi:MAG: DUF2577 domain-containing protein [Eubacterium sp.]|jgi:hypothetical protein|nr:DUF2577 domain-containing protein [Eubacterium sp.]